MTADEFAILKNKNIALEKESDVKKSGFKKFIIIENIISKLVIL